MDEKRLDRIEAKIDRIVEKVISLEVDAAKQEQKIMKRMISMLVLVCSLTYTLLKLALGAK